MEDQQDIAAIIVQSLQNNQIDSVVFLIEDQSEESIAKIKQYIKEEEHRKLFQQAILEVKSKKEKEQYDDQIRVINRIKPNQGSSDSQSVLCMINKAKKKQEKLQQKIGYSFYAIVKFLMISYGDANPTEKAIKMMHSQIQTLFSKIFFKTLKLNSAEIKKYIYKIFEEDVNNYEEFIKLYKNATKGTKKKEDSEDDFPDSSEEQVQVDHCASLSEEQKKYFVQLTHNMTLEEYQKYTEYRTYNFINNKKSPQAVNKFKKFIDPHNVMVEKNVKILSMLSFICCRFVRKVMFQAIREKSPESKLFLLEESIDPVYITKIGNQFIDLFCNKINQYITVKENKEKGEKEVIVEDKESEKAREIFVNQFIDLKYREVLPRKVVLNAQKQGQEKLEHNIWIQNKLYQKMWLQRVNAEQQIEKGYEQLQNGNQDPTYEYSKFILKNYKVYKEKGKGFLWRKYFTNEPVEFLPFEKARKKVKLQSLNS